MISAKDCPPDGSGVYRSLTKPGSEIPGFLNSLHEFS